MGEKIIVITGASAGIGAATAQAFSNAGHEVALLARRLAALEALNLPNAHYFSVDVSNTVQLQKTLERIENEIGPIDCLINNASCAERGNFTDFGTHKNKTMVEVNLLGVINAIEVVIPKMQARKTGTIINISSVVQNTPRPDLAVYGATKAAVHQLSDNLRAENAQHNIRISTIAPSLIATPMLSELGYEGEQALDPSGIANAILWIYEQPQTVSIRDMTYGPTCISD